MSALCHNIVRHPGVQRHQQVQAFLLPHLADDDAAWAHPQRLLHEATKADLTVALEVRLPGLHSDDVRNPGAQLEHLFTGHQTPVRWQSIQQRVQQSRLTGLSGTGDHDVEPADYRGVEEPRHPRRNGAQLHEVIQPRDRGNELADVDRPEPSGHPTFGWRTARDRHFQSGQQDGAMCFGLVTVWPDLTDTVPSAATPPSPCKAIPLAVI